MGCVIPPEGRRGAHGRKETVKMSTEKGPFVRDRIRRIAGGFGWVDHRLVREHYVEKCSHGALALYLFLIVVADGEGVSWWSDRSLSSRLGMDIDRLRQARAELQAADLLAYQAPVWQVLQVREVGS
jgi:hypothetical protein